MPQFASIISVISTIGGLVSSIGGLFGGGGSKIPNFSNGFTSIQRQQDQRASLRNQNEEALLRQLQGPISGPARTAVETELRLRQQEKDFQSIRQQGLDNSEAQQAKLEALTDEFAADTRPEVLRAAIDEEAAASTANNTARFNEGLEDVRRRDDQLALSRGLGGSRATHALRESANKDAELARLDIANDAQGQARAFVEQILNARQTGINNVRNTGNDQFARDQFNVKLAQAERDFKLALNESRNQTDIDLATQKLRQQQELALEQFKQDAQSKQQALGGLANAAGFFGEQGGSGLFNFSSDNKTNNVSQFDVDLDGNKFGISNAIQNIRPQPVSTTSVFKRNPTSTLA